ncbi:MAG: hypothetical protein RL344_744 [Pseudomonadota bacterium]|jgi:hypothetical protein
MELLLSNIHPVANTNCKSAQDRFEQLFIENNSIRIATGYVSEDSLTSLKKSFELNNKENLELLIGMHGYEGFTQPQYDATKYLDDYLRLNKRGEVKIVETFKFHGKMYSFLNGNNPTAAILGSSNLNSLFDDSTYEADVYFTDISIVTQIDSFIRTLSDKSCTPFNQWQPKIVEGKNDRLEGLQGVRKVSDSELESILQKKTELFFNIPIKDEPKSNLNVYFGKGRQSPRGIIKPRHWYEVEIIVSNQITQHENYPKKGDEIKIYTDDGWHFWCKFSGDNAKNLRSRDDLKTLGRWIKGRLERSGALKTGCPVTKSVLNMYGNNTIKLIATSDPSVWVLDFGVNAL